MAGNDSKVPLTAAVNAEIPVHPPSGDVDAGCSSSSSSLTCTQILSLPRQQTGADHDDYNISFTPVQPAWQCTFSPDGQYLAVAYGAPDPCIRVYQHRSVVGTSYRRFLHHRKGDQRDSQAADSDRSDNPTHGKLDDKEEGEKEEDWVFHSILSGIHERTIRSVAFAPVTSPLVLASASFDGTVAIWEYSPQVVPPGEPVTWECTTQLEGHENEVKCVCWNSTGSLLATCGRDKSVWIWECFLPGTVGGPARSGSAGGDFECIAVLHGHQADVKCATFAPSHGQWGDGDDLLLSASYDQTVLCWAEEAGDWYCAATLAQVHTGTIWSLALAPSGMRFLSASDDGSLAIYKSYTAAEQREAGEFAARSSVWKCVGKLAGAHSSTIYAVHYAPARVGHGRVVSAGADQRLQIYREGGGSTLDRPLFSLEASVSTPPGTGDINDVRWHPLDGSILASASDDGSVHIWTYQVSS